MSTSANAVIMIIVTLKNEHVLTLTGSSSAFLDKNFLL